jgi:hypothetical protein
MVRVAVRAWVPVAAGHGVQLEEEPPVAFPPVALPPVAVLPVLAVAPPVPGEPP